MEIYGAKVGSFIPKLRQIKQGVDTFITISTLFSNMIPIFEKLNKKQQLDQSEVKLIQPVVAINSTVNISNVFYNGKQYNTSSFPLLNNSLDNKKDDNLINKDLVFKTFESQNLTFLKIDTNKNNPCSGIIKNLSEDNKKIIFHSLDIKQKFNFSNTFEPFKKKYLVDVNVYYNPDGSIARYEIINLIDYEERDLFNVTK